MKKIALLLILSSLSFSVFGQDTYLKWAKQFAGNSPLTYGRGWGIATDADGNVYSAGVFTGTVDFDPGPAVFNLTPISTDVYISKLDSAGKFVWAGQITGSFGSLTRSLSLDKDRNVYVTGTFQATVDFDPGPAVFTLTSNGTSDLFVLKLSENGDFIWARNLGNASAAAFSYSTTTDSFGNIYFTGSYSGTIDFDPGPGTFTLNATPGFFSDIFICKLDPSGNFVWAGSIGAAGQDVALGIHVDKTNNIYVTGFFGSTVDFDPGPGVFNLASNGQEDMFMLKLNAAGNFTWARSIGGTSVDYMHKAVTDDAGNIYATGFFRGTVDFDPGPAVFNLSAAGDAVFVLKMDAAGNFTWAKNMGGPGLNNSGMAIDLDKLGNVYTTGFFIGPADFDPGPGTYILNSGGLDIFISKLTNNGDFSWAKSAGAAKQDQGLAITIDRSMNIYTTGLFGATVDFDLEASTYNLSAIPVSDPFVLKVAQCASAIYTTTNAAICQGQFYFAGGANQTTSGVYRDTLLTLIGCDSIIITNLVVHPKPNPNLGPDANICSNTQTVLSPGIFSSYTWQDNSTQPSFTVNSAGKYWVTVIDANNCSASDTINILSLDTMPVNFLPVDQELCYGNVLRISAPNYASYQWSTGSTGNYIDINNFGTYYLTVKDFNSCTGTDSITIQRKNCIYIAIPNAFSPDGNSLNDVFKPVINQAIKAYQMIVFNRYGQTVFETRDYGTGWDGSFKGKPQLAGSYVYRISYTNISGTDTIEHGSVLLMR